MEYDLAALNRQAILAAKPYMGSFAWGTVALAAAMLMAYPATLWLTFTGALPLWAGFAVIAAVLYMSYTPLHEAVHGNIHGDRAGLKWVNDLCGYLCGQLTLVPYSTHKVEHFTHHRFTNQAGKDPDYVVSRMGDGLAAFIVTIGTAFWTQVTFLFENYWTTAPRREKAIYVGEIAVALTWRAALLMLLPLQAGLVLVVGAFLAAAAFTTYWFAYRPHHPYRDSARYRNTNSLIMPAWMAALEWFWLGQNLHSIHHAFPRVPFYRYHALFRKIEPILREHGAPVIGIFNRKPVAMTVSGQARPLA
jgi:beta-carotene hydroxylase